MNATYMEERKRMNKEKVRKIENNIIAATIAFALAYIIGSFIFHYDLGVGPLWYLLKDI